MRVPAGRAHARGGGLRGRHRRGRARRRAARAWAPRPEPRVARSLRSSRARAAECDIAVVGPTAWASRRPAGSRSGSAPSAGASSSCPGHVACVAHSGSIGEAFLACGPRVGYRTVVSAGSELSRDIADFVAFLAEDEGTRAIGLFVETIRRPEAFAAALARAADAGKPVVCLKVGRSQAAARAALAHSGAVVGLGARVLGAAPPSRRDRGRRLPRVAGDARGARPAALAARPAHRGRLGVGRRVRAAGRPRRGGRRFPSQPSTARSRPDSSKPSPTSRSPRTRSTAGPSTPTSTSSRARSPSCARAAPTTSCWLSSTSRAIAARTRRGGAHS